MSVYYYLACNVHLAAMPEPIAVAHMRGFDFDGRDEPPRGQVTAFTAEHIGCGEDAITVIDEHRRG